AWNNRRRGSAPAAGPERRGARRAAVPRACPGASLRGAFPCPGHRGALVRAMERAGLPPGGGQWVPGNAWETFLERLENERIRRPNSPVQAVSSRGRFSRNVWDGSRFGRLRRPTHTVGPPKWRRGRWLPGANGDFRADTIG